MVSKKCKCLISQEGFPCLCLTKRKRQKEGFSLAEHKTTGEKLHAAHDMLCTLTCSLSNFYTHKSQPVRLAEKALNALDGLRCELDNAVFRENPGINSAECCRIYYSANSEKKHRDEIR